MSVNTIQNSSNMKLTQLIIDSNDRTSGNNSKFTYDLGTTIEDIRLINIKSVSFENLIYNINTYQNSFIFTSPLGVTNTINIPDSIYSITRLSLLLEDELNAISDSNTRFRVNFDDFEKVTINTVKGITPFSLNFTGATSIGDVLGFGSNEYNGITTLTGTNPLNLSYTKHIYLGSTILGENSFDRFILSNGASNIIKKINLDKNFGDIIQDDQMTNINLRKDITALTTLDFNIVDDRNRSPPLNNANIIITLDIYSRIFNNSYSI
jgi:phosphotransferase system IIB component